MKRAACLLSLAGLVLAGCEGRITESEPVVPSADALLRQNLRQWNIVPIADMPAQNPALVALGRALFFDKILSGNRDISCATCHHPSTALGDGLSLAVGTGGWGSGLSRRPAANRPFVPRQSPTLLNSGLGQFYMFWDGRLSGRQGGFNNETGVPLPGQLPHALIAQGMLPVLNRREMRGEPGDRDVFGQANELAVISDANAQEVWQAVMKRLTSIPEYVQLFSAAFPTKPASLLRFEDAAHALAVFQMASFTRVNTPFDRFLDRDDGALTAEQKRGAALFFGNARCSQCHNGPFLGAQGFANAGVPQIGPGAGRQLPLDLGRGEIQNNEFYKFAFRVPPLRNVELTAPYMHDGAYATLDAVLVHYNDVTLALRSYDASQLSPEVRALYHGDAATVNALLPTLDQRLRQPLDLTDAERSELIAFLKSLTDPAARDLSAIVPARVPSGLPGN